MKKNRYRLLSYALSAKTPLYGNTPAVSVDEDKKIRNGASCNTFMLNISNHSGTHIDAPRHFYDSGKRISDYSINELIFNSPLLIDCPKNEGELVMPKDLMRVKKCDLLLIRTGFFKHRKKNKYRMRNPGISPEASEYIRKELPFIKAVGIDAISISSFLHREEGRRAHGILLAGRGVLLIEDINLSGKHEKLNKVYVVPLYIDGIDSTVCTVFAEYN